MLVKLEWLGYRMVKKLWRCVKPFSSDTGTLRTDGQTDRQADRFAISISRVSVLTCDKNRCWVVLGPALKKRDVNVGPMSGLSFVNTTPTIYQRILVDGPTIRSIGPTLAQRSSADWDGHSCYKMQIGKRTKAFGWYCDEFVSVSSFYLENSFFDWNAL